MSTKGCFVHGVVKIGNKSHFSSHVSPKVRDFIMKHLRLGLSIRQIMEKHKKHFMEVCKRGEELSMDYLLVSKTSVT